MAALFAGPGAIWPWLGILSLGWTIARPATRAACLPVAWAPVLTLPLGVCLYAFLLVPALALLPPGAAPATLSLLAAAALAAVLLRERRQPRGVRPERLHPWSRSLAAELAAAIVLLAAAAVVTLAATRFTLAVMLQAPIPAVLGEPSPLDSGLHALRSAMIARHGFPAPSPLDPDYPLQYRFPVNVLAAAFAVSGPPDYAATSAAAGGLTVGALVLAAGALIRITTSSTAAALAGGLLGALSGPTYWLPDALSRLRQGALPTLDALSSSMGQRWALSPLTPSFPSVFSSLGSSLWLPFSVLSWTVCLIVGAVAWRAGNASRPRWLALLGLEVAILAFSAEFFLPLAAGAALAIGAAWLVSQRLHRQPIPWRALLRQLTWAGAGLFAGLLLFIAATRQLSPTGAARRLTLLLNASAGSTPTYGGNHALLAGGTPLPLPNWVQAHDWGLLFWPASAGLLLVSIRRREPVLALAATAALLGAVFWHAFTLAYEAGAETDLRVQMYRYASMATAIAGPFAAGLIAVLLRGRFLAPVRAAALALVTLVGAGAGLYLVAGSLSLEPEPPQRSRADAAAASRLAQEPPGGRLALLNGPGSFLEFYTQERGYSVAIWLGRGGTSIPIGWDFGHPERYVPLYRRAVHELDPLAAAELRLTHVAYAPATLSADQQARVQAFLARCAGTLIDRYGDQSAPEGRALWRINPDACAAPARP